jgi:hypothetical protein
MLFSFFSIDSFIQLMMNSWVCRTGLSVLDAPLDTGSLK